MKMENNDYEMLLNALEEMDYIGMVEIETQRENHLQYSFMHQKR